MFNKTPSHFLHANMQEVVTQHSVTEKPQINICLCDFTARDIKIVKPLEDVEVNEYESASFVCEISHDEVQTQWYKNDNKLKAADNIRMRQEGKMKKGDLILEWGGLE